MVVITQMLSLICTHRICIYRFLLNLMKKKQTFLLLEHNNKALNSGCADQFNFVTLLLPFVYYLEPIAMCFLPCIYYPGCTTLCLLSCVYYPVCTTLCLIPCVYYPVCTTLCLIPCVYYPVCTTLCLIPCV